MKRNYFELWIGNKLLERAYNLNPTAGKNYALDTIFNDDTPEANWYLGLISASPTPTLAVSDTLASHSGYSEITGLVSARILWNPSAASAGSKTAAAIEFEANATISVAGAFLCSASSGTSGILFAETIFANTYDLVSGNTFRVTYTVNGI